jgi:hypothetical protein
MSNVLNRELIRTVMGSLGIVPPPNFGKVGITTNDFLLDEHISLDFEDKNGIPNKEKFAMWCGITAHGSDEIKVLLTDICDNETGYHEFILVYRLSNYAPHILKHVFSDDDFGLFLRKVEKEWRPVGQYEKLVSCAGFCQMSSLGLTWVPCKDYTDLYPLLIEGVEM